MIRAVVFDIDGTLSDSAEAVMEFYRRVMMAAGYREPSRNELKKIVGMAGPDAIRFLSKETDAKRIEKAWEMSKTMDQLAHMERLPEGFHYMIAELHGRYKLALVTSRIDILVDEFYKLSNSRKYFDVVVKFGDYKVPKPDPEGLLIALDKLDVRPEEAVYVGDTATDFYAAQRAHMHFILYGRKIPTNLKNEKITLAKKLKELPDLIKKLK